MLTRIEESNGRRSAKASPYAVYTFIIVLYKTKITIKGESKDAK